MNKKIKNEIFIYVCVLIMTLFMLFIINNISSILFNVIKFSNQDTNNFIYIAPDRYTGVKDEDWDEELNESKCSKESFFTDYITLYSNLKKQNNIILKVSYLDIGLNNSESNNIGIYCNGKYTCKYNLIKGRFFNSNDMQSNTKELVIGKDILKKCIKENNQYYLYKDNEKIKVIGVIGYKDKSSTYDNYIFYNLDAFINEIRDVNCGQWTLDSTVYNSKELKNIIIKNRRDTCLKGDDNDINKTSEIIKDTISKSKDLFISLFIILITMIIALIQSIIYWIDKMRVEVGIRRQSGASRFIITISIIRKFYIAEAIALLSSLLIIFIYSKLNSTIVMYYFNYELIFIILFLLILGIIPGTLISILLKRNTISALTKEGNRWFISTP